MTGRMVFAQRFTEQWLRTRELSGDKAPDAKLFPAYAADEELRADIRFQPIMFFRELMLRNMSLLNLLDSKYTIGTSNLAKHFGVELPLKTNARKQPQWLELPAGIQSRRTARNARRPGGVLPSLSHQPGPARRMDPRFDSGYSASASSAKRPALEEAQDGVAAKSVRERLTQHRANPVVRELPQPHRSARLRARELRCDRHDGGIRKVESRWTTPAS